MMNLANLALGGMPTNPLANLALGGMPTNPLANLPSVLQGMNDKQQKLSRYKLASDAKFSQKFNYFCYRLWNAIKSIFKRSDWQCVQREMNTMAKGEVKKVINAIPFASFMIDTSKIDEVVEKMINASNHCYIDAKLEQLGKDSTKKKVFDLIIAKQFEVIFDKVVDHLDLSLGSNLKGQANNIRYDQMDSHTKDTTMNSVNVDSGIANALIANLKTPGCMSALWNLPAAQITNDVAKEILNSCRMSKLIEKSTSTAIQACIDITVETVQGYANSTLMKVVQQFASTNLMNFLSWIVNGNPTPPNANVMNMPNLTGLMGMFGGNANNNALNGNMANILGGLLGGAGAQPGVPVVQPFGGNAGFNINDLLANIPAGTLANVFGAGFNPNAYLAANPGFNPNKKSFPGFIPNKISLEGINQI